MLSRRVITPGSSPILPNSWKRRGRSERFTAPEGLRCSAFHLQRRGPAAGGGAGGGRQDRWVCLVVTSQQYPQGQGYSWCQEQRGLGPLGRRLDLDFSWSAQQEDDAPRA